jgi:hypothetical protein
MTITGAGTIHGTHGDIIPDFIHPTITLTTIHITIRSIIRTTAIILGDIITGMMEDMLVLEKEISVLCVPVEPTEELEEASGMGIPVSVMRCQLRRV